MITLTEKAAKHVARYLDRRGKGVGLRLGVKRPDRLLGPCHTSWTYVDDLLPEDSVFESHGIKVIVDPKSLPYIDGTELDFAREGLNEGFPFQQPQCQGRMRLRRVVPGLSARRLTSLRRMR
ncbi:HesB/IscA family protein [Cupriavidus basilensis]